MGIHDLRQEGPPADIGTFQFPSSIMVFHHLYAGTTYACALRRGEGGWVLVAYEASDTAVIQSAFNALTVNRFWKEEVICIGNFTITYALDIPGYIDLNIKQAAFTLGNNANCDMFTTNANRTEIYVHGGKLFGNHANNNSGCGFNVSCYFSRFEYIYIRDFKQDGFWLNNKFAGNCVDNFFLHIRTRYNDGIGYRVGGGAGAGTCDDNYGEDIISDHNKSHGCVLRATALNFLNLNCYANDGSGIINYASVNRFLGCVADGNGVHGFVLDSTYANNWRNEYISCKAMRNGQTAAGDGFHLEKVGAFNCHYNDFVACNAYDDQGTQTQDYGFQEVGACDYNVILGGQYTFNQLGSIVLIGTNSKYRYVPALGIESEAGICFNASSATMTNMPAGLLEFLNVTSRRCKKDLTVAKEARLVVNVVTVGAAGAVLRAQYSTDEATWFYLDGATGPEAAIDALGTIASSWVALASGAKADVFIRVVSLNGDGVADPAFGLGYIQFR